MGLQREFGGARLSMPVGSVTRLGLVGETMVSEMHLVCSAVNKRPDHRTNGLGHESLDGRHVRLCNEKNGCRLTLARLDQLHAFIRGTVAGVQGCKSCMGLWHLILGCR